MELINSDCELLCFGVNVSGVCCKAFELYIQFNKKENTYTLENVKFFGGCPGNAIGISQLTKGKLLTEIISQLKGIPCGNKTTSCPDQLALALEDFLSKQEKN